MEKCVWANDASNFPTEEEAGSQAPYLITKQCSTKWCPSGKLDVAKSKRPETLDKLLADSDFCADWTDLPGSPPDYSLCCDPPTRFDRTWPVVPSYLWSHYDDSEDADVSWDWANNFGNNDGDTRPNNLEEEPGEDPYGFVMLDGTPGSIQNQFGKDFTVVEESEQPRRRKRSSPLTNDRAEIDGVFEHKEETIRVYCNHAHDSPRCRRIFFKGAEDTIIKLPSHIGDGPWARIVSMEPEPESETAEKMPSWVARKRAETENRNGN